MNMKKMLVLSPRFPYPVIGGDRLRIYELCKALSSEFEITLLSLCENHNEMIMRVPDDGVFAKIERIYLPKWRSWLNSLFALPSKTPLQVAYYNSGVFRASFERLVRENDVVLCHLIRTANYAIDCQKPTVIEFTDAISLNYLRIKQLVKNRGFRQYVFSLEQRRLESYEKLVGRLADLNIFVSSLDAEYLFPRGTVENHKTLVCSNGVDVKHYPFNAVRDSKKIAFIGNMNSVQNMDAALWFAKEVMPQLVNDGFVFKVVGRITEANKRRLNSFQGVNATGGVDSVVEAVSDCFVGVCPMRIGAGVQNKILEYMSLGLPCITSTLGFEGLEAEPGIDLIVEDEPSLVAGWVVKIFDSPTLGVNMARSARAYVEKSHSWAGRVRPVLDRIIELSDLG